MTASCYGIGMATSKRPKKRPMTDDERQRLAAAQSRLLTAEQELRDALAARNALYRELYADAVGVTAMARVTDQDRTTVQRIVTPPKSKEAS